MLFHALDELLLSITGFDESQRKVKIVVNGRTLPVDAYRKGTTAPYKEWLAPIEAAEAEAKRKEAEAKKKAEELELMKQRFAEMMEENKRKSPWFQRFDWIQKHRNDDTDEGYTAFVFQFIQMNLKDGRGYEDCGFQVGDHRYRGGDIRTMLNCITVDDLIATPEAVTKQLNRCGIQMDNTVPKLMIVTAMVEYWFKIAKERGKTIEEYECKRPRRITTVSKYAKTLTK